MRTCLTGRWNVFALSVALLVCGCGGGGDLPEMGTVTGVVTLDFEPVEGAIVMFTPMKGSSLRRPAYGYTGPGGEYEALFSDSVDGVPIGPCEVSISTADQAKWQGKDYSMTELFPTEYQNKFMQIEIAPGANVFDFECQTEGQETREITE